MKYFLANIADDKQCRVPLKNEAVSETILTHSAVDITTKPNQRESDPGEFLPGVWKVLWI